MSRDLNLDAVGRAVAESGVLADVSVDAERLAVTGTVTIAATQARMRAELRAPFPAARPLVMLDVPDQFGPLPHLNLETGEVCYSNQEAVLLDWQRPEELVVECLRRAINVLEKGIAGELWADYVDEYEAHWRSGITARQMSIVDPADEVREVILFERGDATTLADDTADIESFNGGKLPKGTVHRALLIPLTDPLPMVPVPDTGSLPELRRALWAALSDADRHKLRRMLKHRNKKADHVVLQVPRPSGEPALVGLLFEGIVSTHPLLERGDASVIRRLVLVRADRGYLLPRGGASLALQERHVAVVGCGAVGGRIVDELAHAGVAGLLLVDPDTVSTENTMRHLLGRPYWKQGKAEALADWVRGNIPFLKTSAYKGRFHEVVDKVPPDDLAELDLIIFATGSENAELSASAHLRAQNGPPLLFAWLEPLGIGGHALLELPGTKGCRQCLNTGPSGELVENRASFVAPGQTSVRDLSGCGSPFTPFSNMNAVQTATLATRLALDFFSGAMTEPCLRSWRGDAGDFLEAGLVLSERYSAFEPNRGETFAAEQCRICGSRDG